MNERDVHQFGRPTLHPALATLLRRLQQAERTATGEERRPMFRLMRDVLGAALADGVPLRLLAECLETTPGSVRNRAQRQEVFLSSAQILELTGLTAAQLGRASGDGLLEVSSNRYRASAVVRALLRTSDGEHR